MKIKATGSIIVMSEEELIGLAEGWCACDPCPHTRKVVQGWLDGMKEGDEKAFEKAKKELAPQHRIKFGTAGLRAEMGAGYSKMNDLVVLQTALGIAAYLERTVSGAKEKGVVLGYDHRSRSELELSSSNFALISAAVFLSRGFKVEMFSELVCTPLVPFAVEKYGCAAGIMITASHNPKQDNGYKVYWGNGCQIIPPHDKGIAACILENLTPVSIDASEAAVRTHPMCHDPLEDVVDDYMTTIADKLCNFPERKSQVKVAYTAMHGVGGTYFQKAFKAFRLDPPTLVKEQFQPDPTFPTVEYPNPEEGDGALELAYRTAESAGCELVLANDPDADRLAVAERRADGSWRSFSGNEIGALLGTWMLHVRRRRFPSSPRKIAIVAATVSSKMLRAVADKEGFHFEETLTGFKWIGNRSAELRAEGYDVIFGFEQAIGFCLGDVLCDKDGISAAAVFAEMAAYLKLVEKRTSEQMQEYLRKTNGYFDPNEGYVFMREPSLVDMVFARLRNDGKYWFQSMGYKIAHIRDLKSPGYDSASDDGRPTLPMGSSEMITYTFSNGYVLTLRPSGTEPKLKYYAEGQCAELEGLKENVAEFVKMVVKQDMLAPLLQMME